MKAPSLVVLLALLTNGAAEPAPRRPVGQVIKVATALPYISGVAELPDGRLIVSDHKTPRVSLIAPVTGQVTAVGSAGSSSGQFVRPGGFYGTPAGGLWLLDRGLARASAVSASGGISESKSLFPRGSSGSSDSDYDLQQLDQRGMAYYFDRDSRLRAMMNRAAPPAVDIIRFDPTTQKRDVVAKVLQRVTQTMSGGDGMTYSRAVIGSPADGWGVAADGRVAIVRAMPYRVDWYSPAGVEAKGPVYQVDVLPMTEADKKAHLEANSGPGVSVGASSASGAPPASGASTLFADTKPPFDPDYVVVSPAGRVFVPRTTPAGTLDVIYDVFDGRGQRVDRIQLPATSRIVGFAQGGIYVREATASSGFTLKKYEVR